MISQTWAAIAITILILFMECTLHRLPIWIQAHYAAARLAIHYALNGDYESVYLEQLKKHHGQYEYEVSMIAPINPEALDVSLTIVRAFAPWCTDPRHPVDLFRDISFCRLQTSFIDRVSCDFCSFCNGIIHTIESEWT